MSENIGPMKHMRHFMGQLNLEEEEFEFYGKYTGKIRLNALANRQEKPDGKLILVTAITPTRAGEGKTLTSIGLGQGLKKIGKNPMITLREPSLGPVFGIKGGATGGGKAGLLPMERINLHFNGDLHAITTAHNLLAALVDNHLHHGNELGIDLTRPVWNRAMDMNERALRNVVIGLGGYPNGIPRESNFIITAASEIMAILALAESRRDLKRRLGNIIVGFTRNDEPVKASDLNAEKALAVVLNEAIMPNLVQTTEHVPTLVHAGPFANIAHGTNSVIANRMALKFADYVVTEAGFGADLGAEKFIHIVSQQTAIKPDVFVIVATLKALKWHGGCSMEEFEFKNLQALKDGTENLSKHIENIKNFGGNIVVAINRFENDDDDEIDWLIQWCQERGISCEAHSSFKDGGKGAADLAEAVVYAAENPSDIKPLYSNDEEPEIKIGKIAREIYGAKDLYFETKAEKELTRFKRMGYGHLPICIAKTQSSLSDKRNVLGAPKDWTLTVTDMRLSAGAGFLIPVCGNMMLMPGLPKKPSAMGVDVDESGIISGLF
ncbi:MAG: formate--tetrahydrofolate ligase [Balneolaceae bacterium]|nr:formate--tetrahydrofolate ligase [Balneolaceae bacterium]